MGEVGGHQHRVSGREGARLAVAHAGVDQVGAFTRAASITADGHVEGWRGGEISVWFIEKYKITATP